MRLFRRGAAVLVALTITLAPALGLLARPQAQAQAREPEFASDAAIDWSTSPVMRVLGRMAETVTDSEYTHGFRVNERVGVYAFDCSGMVHWVLRRATPRAAAASAYGLSGRPLARDYQRRISRIPLGATANGWRRIQRVDEARPGDVLAWIKPTIVKSANTGHVAFVLRAPEAVPGTPGGFLVRIADSTSLLHDADTREGRSGFGFGTILLVADSETGEPRAYGWVGLRWRTFETAISIGRPLR
jgi:hypothetical protein